MVHAKAMLHEAERANNRAADDADDPEVDWLLTPTRKKQV